ncbi:MAG TPA: VOC family protein [Saprospiraceae bacterium]|nr:VOC family protein [Saprospiraceae bacterium]
MISKISHTCIYVLDQDRAYDFYVNKLGFIVHTDAPMGEGARWLTVTPPEQPELEITLFLIKEGGMFDEATVESMTTLIKRGTFGSAVFTCKNLLATYEELTAKGVVFKKPPTKEFYGFEALFMDDSGNWFSLVEESA